MIEAQQILLEEIIKYPNAEIHSFNNNLELVTDLDNYKDQAHYGPWVNSEILNWIKTKEYQITPEILNEYIADSREIYCNYDYMSLHK